MTRDDDDSAIPRSRRRPDTRPHLRAAVLVCSPGSEASEGLARLREIAWERELYVEVVTFDPEHASRMVAERPDAVFVMGAHEPRAHIERLLHVCATRGATLVVAATQDERAIRASVVTIEDSILLRLDPGQHGRAGA